MHSSGTSTVLAARRFPAGRFLATHEVTVFASQSSEHFYYRVVPGQPSRVIELVLIGVGLLLVLVSVFLRFRK
jgi:hypothetical protein